MGQAWTVASMPIVECYLPFELAADWGGFSHSGTRVRDYKLEGVQLQHGETVWRGTVEGKPAAVGWEWVEIRPGVLGLLQPNSPATNLRFMAHKACYVSTTQAIVNANRLIHSWPWQQVVCAMLRAQQSEVTSIAMRPQRQISKARLPKVRPGDRRIEHRLAA